VVKKTDDGKYNSIMKKSSGRRNHFTRENMKKQHQRTRISQRIGKERQSILGRKWNCLYR